MSIGPLEMQSSIDLAMNLQYIALSSGRIAGLIDSPLSGEGARLL
jgi:hypothetical protein